jgi:hypothetical protein
VPMSYATSLRPLLRRSKEQESCFLVLTKLCKITDETISSDRKWRGRNNEREGVQKRTVKPAPVARGVRLGRAWLQCDGFDLLQFVFRGHVRFRFVR